MRNVAVNSSSAQCHVGIEIASWILGRRKEDLPRLLPGDTSCQPLRFGKILVGWCTRIRNLGSLCTAVIAGGQYRCGLERKLVMMGEISLAGQIESCRPKRSVDGPKWSSRYSSAGVRHGP